MLRWKVKVQLLLGPASLHIRNAGNPGDTVPSGRIRLLRYGADLRVGDSDRRKKTANQNRARIKNRSPPETEKMPDHKKKEGGESEMLLIGSNFSYIALRSQDAVTLWNPLLAHEGADLSKDRTKAACAWLNLPTLISQHA